MPVTPFHFGPAALVKSGASGYFSFLAFGLTQVIIDLEPLYYMAVGAWPIHRFLHTYVGSSTAAILVILAGRPVCAALIHLWNWRLNEAQFKWLSIKPDISSLALVTGALFGAYSHVLLDSIMHSDMQPFAPFSDTNSMLHIISIDSLYDLCALLGILGGAILIILLFVRKSRIRLNEPNNQIDH